jgi:8-oxo-dGTP pyrophosphatase MutT (NUDIX family)
MTSSGGAEAGPTVVATVRRAVREFEPESAREAESRERFLAELDSLVDPLDRDAGPVHVTGSGLVLGPRGTVLHVHRKLGKWLQPGGHLDAGETPWDAALRETAEETGLPVRHPESGHYLVQLDVHPAAEGHVHLDLRYLLLCDDAEPCPPADESQQVRWWELEEAIALGDPGLVDALQRLRRLRETGSSVGS